MLGRLRSEKGYFDPAVVAIVGLVVVLLMIVSVDRDLSNAKSRLAVSDAKVVLLEQGFTTPRKEKNKNTFTAGFGPACKLTLDWDGKKAFSFSRFNAPGLKYPMPSRDIPVMKNATYDKIRKLREMDVCGAPAHHNY